MVLWPWVVAIAIWSFASVIIVSYLLDREWAEFLFIIFVSVLTLCVIYFCLWGTVEFLQYFQAWPWTPQ